MMEEEEGDASSGSRVRNKMRTIRNGMGRMNGRWWHKKRW